MQHVFFAAHEVLRDKFLALFVKHRTAEGAAFPREQLDRLLDLANIGNSQLFDAQRQALAQVLPASAVAALVPLPD